ncbi:MAG TPA: carboxypeptidase regulatory-like domain-containing protein [Candidatus Sulfotelmatobacter sp.]
MIQLAPRRILLLFVISFFLSVTALAQYSGNVQGIVSDPSGAAIHGATVQLRNPDTGVAAVATTTDTGFYRFSSLPPGTYALTVEAGGFRKAESKFTLETSETRGLNLTLPLASAQQTITVEENPPAVDTDDSRLQATLSSESVRDLPEANRNLWDVLAVEPGVVGLGTRGPGESPGGFADNFGTQTPQISANGRSYTGNLVMVDGMNVTSPVQNGNIILAPIPDAVQEASLQTNSWDAEDNLGSSILIQVTTKSGTNQFHGSGSLFFTNQDLQATPEFASGGFTPHERKDLVGTLGGPIRKGKTFFFADFEKLWATTAAAAIGLQQYEAPEFIQWAQTNFPNTVGTQVLSGWPASNMVGSTYQTAATYTPFLNASGVSNCGTPVGTPPIVIPCNLPILDQGNFAASPYYNALQYNFRLDNYFTEKDRLYLSYYNDAFDQQQTSPRPRLSALDIMRNRYGQIDFTHTFNANLLWESSFAFASVGGANGQDANLQVPAINVIGQNQGFQVGGGWGPGEYRGPMYNWRSVLHWVHGNHTWKFGYDGGHGIEHGDFTPVNVRPTLNFNSLLDLVQDNPQSENGYSYNPKTGGAGLVIFGGQETPYGFFAQDDWKAKPNLSLTLSLRWDDFTNHTAWGPDFQFSNLILPSGSNFQQQIAGATVQPVSGVFANPIRNLWSPRIGFSWDPSKTGQWVVRGGIGVYHDWIALGQSVDEMRTNPPALISPTFNTTEFPNLPAPVFALAQSGSYPFNFPVPTLTPAELAGEGGAGNVVALDRNLKAPLAVNYVIGMERQLPLSLVAGANYSGSRSYDALNGTDVNRFDGALLPTNTGPTVLNTKYAGINYVNNANAATYNGLILFLRGKAGHRGAFQASYTLSHVQDYPEAGTRFDQDTSPQGTAYNIPDPTAYFSYWGDANYDVRQRFSFSGLYNIPGAHQGVARVLTGGWELSSIAAIQSGTPFWVIDTRALAGGGDYNADGIDYDVPNMPSQNFTGSHSRTAYEDGLFTAADFPAPAAGTEGDEKRNLYRNPGVFQLDASLLKNNHIPWFGEQGNLQFRFDFINLFNHVNLGTVDPFIGDGSFGKVTTALPARQLQLGLRVAF